MHEMEALIEKRNNNDEAWSKDSYSRFIRDE